MSYTITDAKFVPYPTQWRKFRSSKQGPVGGHINKVGKRLFVLAKEDAPVGKSNDGRPYVGGKLKSSMYMVYKSHWNPQVIVGANTSYAYYVHEGTRPHTIRPKKSKALRFVYNGRVIYAQKVSHPGQKKQPFLSKNLRKVIR